MDLSVPLRQIETLTIDETHKFLYFPLPYTISIDMLKRAYRFNNSYDVDYKKILKASNTWQQFFFLAETSYNEEAFVQKHTVVSDSKEIAKHYVVRKSNWGEQNYNIDQILYGNKLHEGVLIGEAALSENRWNFFQMLSFFAYHRMKIAQELGKDETAPFVVFGLNRLREDVKTGCFQIEGEKEGIYEALGLDLLDLIPKWEEEKDTNYNAKENCIEIEIEGQKLPLSYMNIEKRYGEAILHAPLSSIRKVLEYTSKIYEQCLEEDNNEVLLEKLGQIFWLICQAKPWFRGDPSIAEMLIKSVWLHKTGEMLPPWKKGLIPWESVMKSTNLEDFGAIFRTLFSKDPIK